MKVLPSSKNLQLKNKRRMLYLSIDLGELKNNVLLDTSALIGAISEADLQKIPLLAPQTIFYEGPPVDFQILVPDGPLETPSAGVELHFEVGNTLFQEFFIFMTTLTSPLMGLLLLETNSTMLVRHPGVLNLLFFLATQTRRQCVLQYQPTFVKPNKHSDSTRKANSLSITLYIK